MTTDDTKSLDRLRDFVTDSLDLAIFDDGSPCPISFEDGISDRLLVVTGENASGKSLYCRVLGQMIETETEAEVIRIGMELRTQGGLVRAFVFGDEETESTGSISSRTLTSGESTIRGRTAPHYLMFDEPDIGMGEGYQTAAGHFLARLSGDLPDLTGGLVVVSHARHLVAPLIEAGAMSIRVGDDLRPVREWIEKGDLPKSIEDLMSLAERSHHRYRAIHEFLKPDRSDPE